MKKTLFLSAAASLSLAMSFEEYQHLVRTSIALRRDDESADNSLYWVDNGGRTRYADDEADDGFYWVDNGHTRFADDEAYWVDNKHGGGKNGGGKYGGGKTKTADDEGDDSFYWVDNKYGGGRTKYADDEAFWVDNKHSGGKNGGGKTKTKTADDEGDDSFYWVDNKYGSGRTRYADDADDEFMAKGHGQGQERSQKQKGDKKKGKDGKKPRPTAPIQEAPADQTHDNILAVEDFQDDELVMDSIKNGYYTATNWVLANPVKVNQAGIFIANGLMNPKWDDEELSVRRPVQEKTNKKPSKLRPTQPEVQADNTLFALGDLIAEGADN